MAKRFWAWLIEKFKRLGKTEDNIESWQRLEFKDRKRISAHRESS